MEKKIITLLMSVMFLIVIASATETVNQPLDLKVVCLNDGYCSASAYCNINVAEPNNTLIVDGQNMTNQINFHNYTILPTVLGVYEVSGFCKDGVDSQEIDFTFHVTQTGSELTTAISLNVLIIILLIIFIAFCIGYLGLKAKNGVIMISFLSFTVLILIFLVGLLSGFLQQTMENFTGISSGIEALYIMFTFLLVAGGVGLMLYLVFVALNFYWQLRGMKDIVSVKI